MSINEFPQQEQRDGFEEYLRTFRPVAAPRLTVARRAPVYLVPAIALLAAIAAVLLIGQWHGAKESEHSVTVRSTDAQTLITPALTSRLNQALRGGVEQFLSDLDRASPRILSKQHPGSAFYQLSKE